MSKYDYEEIQKFLDQNNTWRQTVERFGISMNALNQARRRGELRTRTNSEAQKFSRKIKPILHTEATKKKISKIRKEYLAANPDKVPYLLNHSSRCSYPEQYFIEVFKQYNLNVKKSYRVGTYELDFALIDIKVDIEIDGEQHYVDKRIVEHDKKRTKFLTDLGWKTKRIRWSEYQRLNFEEKKKFIEEFIANVSE
jgi:very-short-patch-repair endonuclease